VAVQILGLLGDAGRGHTVGEHGQTPCKPTVEGIEGVDPKPLRLREHVPPERAIAGDDGGGQFETRLRVRLAARRAVGRRAQSP
jgi:hypothetical protein